MLPSRETALTASLEEVDVMLATRIFIAKDIDALAIRVNWAKLVEDYVRDLDKRSYKAGFQGIRKTIVDRATEKTKH